MGGLYGLADRKRTIPGTDRSSRNMREASNNEREWGYDISEIVVM